MKQWHINHLLSCSNSLTLLLLLLLLLPATRTRSPISQEVWYQLSFEGYPESEAEWFPAARIRSEHPQGEQLITAFDQGLEASGQGDVALPPDAAERSAALSFGTTTPQVGR